MGGTRVEVDWPARLRSSDGKENRSLGGLIATELIGDESIRDVR